jgi:hypothetical protein
VGVDPIGLHSTAHDRNVRVRSQLDGGDIDPLIATKRLAFAALQQLVKAGVDIAGDSIVPDCRARHGEDFPAIELVLAAGGFLPAPVLPQRHASSFQCGGHGQASSNHPKQRRLQ